MVRYEGFATKAEAKAYQKAINRGTVCYEASDTEPKGKGQNIYRECVQYGGLDSEKYPYAVVWNEF